MIQSVELRSATEETVSKIECTQQLVYFYRTMHMYLAGDSDTSGVTATYQREEDRLAGTGISREFPGERYPLRVWRPVIRDVSYRHSSWQRPIVVVTSHSEHDSTSDDVNGSSALGFLKLSCPLCPNVFFFSFWSQMVEK